MQQNVRKPGANPLGGPLGLNSCGRVLDVRRWASVIALLAALLTPKALSPG